MKMECHVLLVFSLFSFSLRARFLSPCLLTPLLSFLILLGACSEQEAPPRPPPELPVVDVIQRDQPIEIEMVGQTIGSSDIPIRARVDGFLKSMDFAEGGKVQQGDLLYTIDDVQFQTGVAEAEGGLSEAKTALVKARSDLERIRPLAAINAMSQMDLDSAVAQHEAAKAAVQAVKAQVDQAKITLGYCRIYAPIGGRIGISKVEVGEYVGGAGSGALNFVSRVDPIRVRFSIDEQSYLRIARRFIAKRAEGRQQKEKAALELILADGSVLGHLGHIVTMNAAIDPTTGTFTLEADFPNPDGLVIAGQFARIRANVEVRKAALLVPQRSLVELQGAFSLFVVDAEGKVEQRKVTVGPKINRLQIISSGLKAGEKVVLEGVQKIRTGMTINAMPTDFDEVVTPPSTNAPKA
ncbi:MAG: efflux transporter periplasmic adaptor subunit [Cellvibrionales bacterium]|nr:MAG: efflux transporter periplasmic adaptor subunit [Cellvibrionales bacterium]